MTTTEKIAALRATHGAATPAPWVADVAAMSSTGPDAVYGDYQHPGIEGRPFICETFFNEAADAIAIAAAHNAFPALLTALEDVLEIARRELHDISCQFHSYAALSSAIGACDCWKARVENAIEAALSEVDHG